MTSLVCSFACFHISGFSNFMDEMAFIWMDKNRGARENSGSCEAEWTICFGTVSMKCLLNIQILYPGGWSFGQKLGTRHQDKNHRPMGGFQSIELGYHKDAGLSLRTPALRDQRKKGPWHKKGRRNRECGKIMKSVVSQIQEKSLLKYKELLGCAKHYSEMKHTNRKASMQFGYARIHGPNCTFQSLILVMYWETESEWWKG